MDKRASELYHKKEYFKTQCSTYCKEKIFIFTTEKSEKVGDAVI